MDKEIAVDGIVIRVTPADIGSDLHRELVSNPNGPVFIPESELEAQADGWEK